MACETIPSSQEVDVLLQLLTTTPDVWAWLSLVCRNARELCDGTPLLNQVRRCHEHPQIAAIAVNCVAPQLVAELVRTIQQGTDKPILVYPNSGEIYDTASKRWRAGAEPVNWPALVRQWRALGVAGFGGCCQVGPETILTLNEQRHRNEESSS